MTSMLITSRHISKLSGYAPALPTPFDEEGNVDAPAFERLCDLQLANGATALVVCGTTGEAPTLSPAEHRELIRYCGCPGARSNSGHRWSRCQCNGARDRID